MQVRGPNIRYACIEKFRVIIDSPECVRSEEHLMAGIHYKIFTPLYETSEPVTRVQEVPFAK
jgi:hypothetical protein